MTGLRWVAMIGIVCGGLAAGAEKLVIAHRGASGYLPEHTLEAYAMAYGMGADYIEPDLVLSKDGRFIALHDIHLEGTTDVEEQYPERKRSDGKWYAADFSVEELKSLRIHERLEGRFPRGAARFEIPLLEEVIELIQGLNQSAGRNVGIYPELKQPTFHREAGLPMEERILEVLGRYGYQGPGARVFIQCFEPESLIRLRDELNTELPLVQLISGSARQKHLHSQPGLVEVARYANGIGPAKNLLEENPAYVKWAHELGLVVHPYTLRSDQRPQNYASDEAELSQFYLEYDVDAVFTDFPDVAIAFLKSNGLR